MNDADKKGKTQIRIILLIIYWIVAWPTAIYFSGYGHMSFVPMSILLSWPGVFAKFSGELLVLLPITHIMYYLGLLVLTTKLSHWRRAGAYLIPGFVHFSGGLVFMLTVMGKQYMLPVGLLDSELFDWWTACFYFASYIISIGITVLWLFIDWRLASRGKQA